VGGLVGGRGEKGQRGEGRVGGDTICCDGLLEGHFWGARVEI